MVLKIFFTPAQLSWYSESITELDEQAENYFMYLNYLEKDGEFN